MSYDSYRILLDEPASLPGLGFAAYAAGLADIITTSQPRFAIGIFGGWGSGKTTLMQAIETQLETRPEVVTLWFSAWRFEREDNMIVPLIDVLREALSRLAENDLEPARRAKARIAADRIARAGRALLAGIKVRAVIPGLNVELEAGKVIDAFERGSGTASADVALSFYHAGFTMLDDAIKTFVGHGADRIVIFVDDLDRCLPAKALEVLESMKVFFDTEGRRVRGGTGPKRSGTSRAGEVRSSRLGCWIILAQHRVSEEDFPSAVRAAPHNDEHAGRLPGPRHHQRCAEPRAEG